MSITLIHFFVLLCWCFLLSFYLQSPTARHCVSEPCLPPPFTICIPHHVQHCRQLMEIDIGSSHSTLKAMTPKTLNNNSGSLSDTNNRQVSMPPTVYLDTSFYYVQAKLTKIVCSANECGTHWKSPRWGGDTRWTGVRQSRSGRATGCDSEHVTYVCSNTAMTEVYARESRETKRERKGEEKGLAYPRTWEGLYALSAARWRWAAKWRMVASPKMVV